MFSGSLVALITPFSDNRVDEAALLRLLRHQLDNGTHGIVPTGTTGEAPVLTPVEHARVVEVVTREVAGQVPVIAGTGSNNPVDAITHAAQAASVGANAALHVMGYYNRPNQEGIYQHFRALDAVTELPIVAYNVAARAVIDIQPETMARLATLPSVVGVKDASCDLSRPLRERLLIDGDFCFLSGEDSTAVAYNAHGGKGCISVTANVAPALCSQVQQLCTDGQYRQALELHLQLLSLHRALFMEPSPAGVKFAASLLGLCRPECRLPMVQLESATQSAIVDAMSKLGLL